MDNSTATAARVGTVQPWLRPSFVWSLLAFSAGIAACSSTTAPICPDPAPQPRVTPREHIFAVGASYLAHAEYIICGGTRTTTFDGVWRSGNLAVATVDSGTGLIHASGRGSAYIYAVHKYRGIPGGDGRHDSLLVVVP